MRTDLFDYELPNELIARSPIIPRESAKLLCVDSENFYHRKLGDLPDLLKPDDMIIFNNSRVLPARLLARRIRAHPAQNSAKIADETHPVIELTLHKPIVSNPGTETMLTMPNIWLSFARPGKKLRLGDILHFGGDFSAELLEKHPDGQITIKFDRDQAALCDALHQFGTMPLPPYLHRKASRQDDEDYQTIFAKEEGSVAAPTAGLHISNDLMARLKNSGIDHEFVTLHIGAGTFQPVKVSDTQNHKMHSEYGIITAETAAKLNAVKRKGGRIIACGTTSLRVLESASDQNGVLQPFARETDIFITPGYRFRCVDGLLTNFHLPRSTLMMLVAAFIGLARTQAAYRLAVESGYRFYSYGDASLLLPNRKLT